MSVIKIVFFINIVEEPAQDKYKFMRDSYEEQLNSKCGLPFKPGMTLQTCLDNPISKQIFSFMGMNAILVDNDLRPELDTISLNPLDVESLQIKFKDILSDRKVFTFTKYEDGFVVTALEKKYADRLEVLKKQYDEPDALRLSKADCTEISSCTEEQTSLALN